MNDNETQRDVFRALLTVHDEALADSIGKHLTDKQLNEWLVRFDKAATRVVFLEALAETLRDVLAKWVKDEVVEAASWIKPSARLPEPYVSVWAFDAADAEGHPIEARWSADEDPPCWLFWNPAFSGWAHCDSAYVTHWRPFSAPPTEPST